jgi:hypothetical protein
MVISPALVAPVGGDVRRVFDIVDRTQSGGRGRAGGVRYQRRFTVYGRGSEDRCLW